MIPLFLSGPFMEPIQIGRIGTSFRTVDLSVSIRPELLTAASATLFGKLVALILSVTFFLLFLLILDPVESAKSAVIHRAIV